jgi:hypothetical protein
MTKPQRSLDCTQKRRKLRRHEWFDLKTGEFTPDETRPPTWIVEPCGVPLMTDPERERQTCNGCASGWQSEGNTPVPAETPTLFG